MSLGRCNSLNNSNRLNNPGNSFSFQSYWSSLISAVVENAAPTNVVLTFPVPKSLLSTDFTCTVNGSARAVNSISWTGSVLTAVLASAVVDEDVVVMTFVKSGGTVTVTNNVYIVAPTGWDWTLPLSIKRGTLGNFTTPGFDIETRANITVAKTYYLNSVSGNDSNSGLTPLLPKKTWNNIQATGDYDKVIIQDGSVMMRADSSLSPARNCKFVGEGTVYWTSERGLGTWSLSAGQTNTYQASVTGGEFIARVIDEGVTNALGNPTPYVERASIALVEANAGSFLWSGGVLYVHTTNNASPSGNTNIKYYDSSAIYWSLNNVFYFENINFRGGVTLRNASAAGGAKAYFKDCNLHKAVIAGVEEIILQDCVIRNSNDDSINYDDLNGIASKAIEINCDFGEGGLTSTNQASTGHNNSRSVRVNGKYHDIPGQCVACANSTNYSWLLGSELYNSTVAKVGAYTEGKMWLDTCNIHDNDDYDLQNIVGATTYTRNCTLGKGVNSILGTLAAY